MSGGQKIESIAKVLLNCKIDQEIEKALEAREGMVRLGLS
jgi:hypothetical protein